jgi:hypothetical protein
MPWLGTAFMASVGHAIKGQLPHLVQPSRPAHAARQHHRSTAIRRRHAQGSAALTVPQLQDGELARSAIGGFRVFNDLPSYFAAVECLRLNAGAADESLSVPEALASATGMSLHALTTAIGGANINYPEHTSASTMANRC